MEKVIIIVFLAVIGTIGCQPSSSEKQEKKIVQEQQLQYLKSQPIPVFDWSLERDLVSKLYRLRNQKAITHSVWRSDRGTIEGDCPSYGYGIPYDTSLTNPLKVQKYSSSVVEQPEPNGLFSSKNTSATWVLCLGEAGTLEPIYVETKVTVYPYPIVADYENDTVSQVGKARISIKR